MLGKNKKWRGKKTHPCFHHPNALLSQSIHFLPAFSKLLQDSNQLDMPKIGKKNWRGEGLHTPVFLPGECHGRGARQATVHGIGESDMTERLLNKDMSRSSKDLRRVSG